jgi:hypothetical protein
MRSRLLLGPNLYFCCGCLMILFAMGHTFGFLLYAPPQPEARHVLELMHTVQFEDQGHTFTFYEFYQGFGLLISTYQLFLAAFALVMSRMLRNGTAVPEMLGWLFALVQLVTLTLSVLHFSTPPVVMSALLSVAATAAVVQTRRAGGWHGAVPAAPRMAPGSFAD